MDFETRVSSFNKHSFTLTIYRTASTEGCHLSCLCGSWLGVDGRVGNDEAFDRETLVIEDRSTGKIIVLRVNNLLHCS